MLLHYSLLYVKEGLVFFFFFTDDVELLMDRTTALATKNCDDLYNNGFRTDGIYVIFIGGRFLPMFCEFGRGGYNWLVSKQSVLLRELAVTFFF